MQQRLLPIQPEETSTTTTLRPLDLFRSDSESERLTEVKTTTKRNRSTITTFRQIRMDIDSNLLTMDSSSLSSINRQEIFNLISLRHNLFKTQTQTHCKVTLSNPQAMFLNTHLLLSLPLLDPIRLFSLQPNRPRNLGNPKNLTLTLTLPSTQYSNLSNHQANLINPSLPKCQENLTFDR